MRSFRSVFSRFFGRLFSARFGFLQPLINKAYVSYFKLDLSEFKKASEYESLQALFTRRLHKPRKLEEGFISPCDGKVFYSGLSSSLSCCSIKGKTYSLVDLLGFTPQDNLSYLNIYLSPKDYHNYHSPCNMFVRRLVYFPADLYSVSFNTLKSVDNLYSKNERVLLYCEGSLDKDLVNAPKLFSFYMVFVGAFNVGRMAFDFDKSVQTNAKGALPFTKSYQDLSLEKGALLGRFELGSTVLLFSKELSFSAKEDESLRFGQNIGGLNA